MLNISPSSMTMHVLVDLLSSWSSVTAIVALCVGDELDAAPSSSASSSVEASKEIATVFNNGSRD
jgi:hypothetical protein